MEKVKPILSFALKVAVALTVISLVCDVVQRYAGINLRAYIFSPLSAILPKEA